MLESLDISNNLSLNHLSCPINEIDTFISGDNTMLDFIQIGNNNLTSIDVSNLVNLNTFYCIMNQFNTIDLSQNTNIEKIGCSMNSQLETIDVRNGNNINITEFISTDTPNLTCIFVNDAVFSTENWLNVDDNSTFVETVTECEALNINENSYTNKLSVYPNPFINSLSIDYSNDEEFDISVFDILGKEILKTRDSFIDTSSFKNGFYILKIKLKNNKVLSKKIFKAGKL